MAATWRVENWQLDYSRLTIDLFPYWRDAAEPLHYLLLELFRGNATFGEK